MVRFHTRVVVGVCYFFAAIAAVTGLLALTLGLGLVPDAVVIEPSTDNEFRFFSAFWLGYGAFCIWVARGVDTRYSFVPALAAVMFIAGMGRMLSWWLVGAPNDLYLIGGFVEVIIPPLWYYSSRALDRTEHHQAKI